MKMPKESKLSKTRTSKSNGRTSNGSASLKNGKSIQEAIKIINAQCHHWASMMLKTTGQNLVAFVKIYYHSKSYVCQCGGRFDSEMTLAVHCKLVNHEFREHIHTQKTTSVSIDQRKKMLTSTLPVRDTNNYDRNILF